MPARTPQPSTPNGPAMNDSETAIHIENVSKSYTRGRQKVSVLDGIDLQVARGDFMALMGPSGSGKSTLLNLIGGLDRVDSGTIRVQGTDLVSLSPAALARWRSQKVGFVFQSYNLLPVLSALANVELPLLLSTMSGSERRKRASLALEIVGLADRAMHRPAELSGGQAQRVAIARALVADPEILIGDEPTGDLDRETADDVLGLLQTLNRDHGKTIVMVTHDPKAAQYASTRLNLDKGRLVTTCPA